MNKNVAISSPWYQHFHKIKALFSQDPEVQIDDDMTPIEDGKIYKFSINSDNEGKLAAIKKLVGTMVTFPNDIVIVIEYGTESKVTADTWKQAFEGNPIFKDVVSVDDQFGTTHDFAVFKKTILSFYNDILYDYKGFDHYVAADVAREIVKNPNMYICTE